MRRGLGKNSLLVRKKGKFMKHVGLVCTWFNHQVHVVDIKELPPGDTFFGIDFGFTNPTAGLWVGSIGNSTGGSTTAFTGNISRIPRSDR